MTLSLIYLLEHYNIAYFHLKKLLILFKLKKHIMLDPLLEHVHAWVEHSRHLLGLPYSTTINIIIP